MDLQGGSSSDPGRAEGAAYPKIACVYVPELPLQLLLLAQERSFDASGTEKAARLRGSPVAVIDRDRPQGRILWANEVARRSGIAPGMTYAAALSLRGDLRAGEVPRSAIEGAVDRIVDRLLEFTPSVEPSREDPGAFWLGLRGLERLHPSSEKWASEIRAALLRSDRLESSVAVGFTRFGTYAVARSLRPGRSHRRGGGAVAVFSTLSEELRVSRAVPLDRLPVASRDRDLVPAGGLEIEEREVLEKLGIETVGEFADLPPEGIERRFGKEARWLHALSRRDLDPPLSPVPPEPALREWRYFESGEADASRLSEAAREMLLRIIGHLAKGGLAVSAVHIALSLENRIRLAEALRPAAPTLDADRIQELVSLRLGSLALPDRVREMEIRVESRPVASEQLELFSLGELGDPPAPPRDFDAADRALARIRARFGDRAVVRARLLDGHLPEAQFAWEPLERVPRPRREVRGADARSLLRSSPRRIIRRFYDPPLLLAPRSRHEPDGWIVRSLDQGSVVRLAGPYVISGRWWREPVHREYHFAETRKGEVLWLYYDRLRRRWFLQGRIE